MSTFTQSDYENVKAAYIALATGSRAVTVNWGDKSVIYGKANMAELKSLMAEIQNDLGESDGSFRIIQHSKNL